MLLKAGKNVCSQLMNFKRLLEVQLSKQQCITTNPEEKIFFLNFQMPIDQIQQQNIVNLCMYIYNSSEVQLSSQHK